MPIDVLITFRRVCASTKNSAQCYQTDISSNFSGWARDYASAGSHMYFLCHIYFKSVTWGYTFSFSSDESYACRCSMFCMCTRSHSVKARKPISHTIVYIIKDYLLYLGHISEQPIHPSRRGIGWAGMLPHKPQGECACSRSTGRIEQSLHILKAKDTIITHAIYRGISYTIMA